MSQDSNEELKTKQEGPKSEYVDELKSSLNSKTDYGDKYLTQVAENLPDLKLSEKGEAKSYRSAREKPTP
jgi:hypothetical protein